MPNTATPIPWTPVLLATVALYNAVLHMTIIFPFVPQMLRTFGTKEKEIAWYAGFISSAYFLGAFISSGFWGVISDVSGRKTVVIICTLFSAAAAILFGFSKDFTWAVCARVATGLSNGVLGTSKAIIGDVTDNSNQPAALTFTAIGWSLSLMTAPFIGGLLAEPIRKYSELMGYLPESCVHLLKAYPFLLPNLFAAMLNIFSVILFVWKLEETKPERSNRVVQGNMEHFESFADSEFGLDPPNWRHKVRDTLTRQMSRYSKFVVDLRSVFTGAIVVLVCIYAIFSYSLIGVDEITPVWTSLHPALGGLNFSTTDIAILMGSPAPVGFLSNLYFIPWIVTRLGAKPAFFISGIVSMLTIIVLPYGRLVQENVTSETGFWVILILIWSINRMSAGVGFMSLSILINNSCLKQYLGTVNGLAASASFLARILSPIVCGAVLTWTVQEKRSFPLDHHLTFFILACIVILDSFMMTFVPDSFEKQKASSDIHGIVENSNEEHLHLLTFLTEKRKQNKAP